MQQSTKPFYIIFLLIVLTFLVVSTIQAKSKSKVMQIDTFEDGNATESPKWWAFGDMELNVVDNKLKEKYSGQCDFSIASKITCIIFVLTSISNSFLLSASGWILLDRNTKIMLVSGSAQAKVPVNPECPKLERETHWQVGPPSWLGKAGLSNPAPLLFSSLQNWHF